MRLLPSSSTRSSRWLATLLALACGAAFATSACGGDGAESSGGGRTLNADGGTAGSGGSSGSGGTDQGGTGGIINVPQAVGLEIEPATVQIDVLNGVASPVGVTARVRKDDDSTEDVVPTGWSLSRGGIADFDQATSEVSAVGDLGERSP